MRILLLFMTILYLPITQAQTHNIHVQIESCNVAMTGTLGMQNDVLTIQPLTPNKTYVIDAQQQLSVDGQAIALTTEQQALLDSYYFNIKSAIPMGVEMAAQGLELANTAVNEIFGELLGPDDEMIVKLNELIAQIKDGVAASIYAPDGSIYIDPDQTQQREWLDPQWQTEFDAVIEETIEKYMWKIIVALGKAMLMGNETGLFGNMDPDAISHMIERKLAGNAKALGENSAIFCDIIEAAHDSENALIKTVPEFAGYNFVEFSTVKPQS